jgi:hypothetical protein
VSENISVTEGENADDEENNCFAFRDLLPGSNGIFTNAHAGAKDEAEG